MENILKREPDIDHRDYDELRYGLNSSISEDDNMEIEVDVRNSPSVSIEKTLIKEEPNLDNHIDDMDTLHIKKESVIDFTSEIILPQASQSQIINTPKVKKEVKSKRELEEEEREKMQ